MGDNTSIATKSALQAAFSSASPLPLLVAAPGAHGHISGAHSNQPPGGAGMKLEAVMENLQRQQAARLALEEKLRSQAGKDKDIRAVLEQQQELAFRHYQASVRGALEAHRMSAQVPRATDDSDADDERTALDDDDEDERDMEEEEYSVNDGDDFGGPALGHYAPRHAAARSGETGSPKSAHALTRVQAPYAVARQPVSPHAQPQHHEWTYEEQFKQSGKDSQPGSEAGNSSVPFRGGGGGVGVGSSSLIQELYELDDDVKRKEFLDDLFSFMQKRGTPVNRIPIMAKQVLDLYTLYKLVTEKGGLVEVINKKIWREITRGLNLPTSITSAAFTLRTQYMKYLYPYECEKRGLSSPGELQAAIDSNRREGRRQSYGSALFNYSPVGTPTLLPSPKLPISHIGIGTPNGGQMAHTPIMKKEDSILSSCLTNRVGIPMPLGGHHGTAAAAQAAQAAQAAAVVQAAALEQLREKLEAGEPPEKKVMLMAEEQQRIMQHALQHNFFTMASQLPMNIKLNNIDDRQETALNLSTNGISSINMSIEINGVVYTGILFARKPAISVMPASQRAHLHASSQGKSSSPSLISHSKPSSSSSSASSSSSSHGPAASP
ncbi:AT-rich interactive domain-containing protein 3A isoform X1 [Neoarius graeffei]|uniref:AT-rich interactive domain-containing protein 3A isoform X1 n=1 Tax=Neoarius graeffei TaxID=443677 RepID=UPI00298C559B|nr:AT-rich interactive domain-containing protein 3A isoform X1 [Neoarius graeffei]